MAPVKCTFCGRLHWGEYGAAGIVLVRRNGFGEAKDIVLQHRNHRVAEGGTWVLPGGGIEEGESAWDAALRKAKEEVSLDASKVEVAVRAEHLLDHGNWSYTTFVADVKGELEPKMPEGDFERLEVKWVPIDEVENYTLLPACKADWPAVKASIPRR